MLPSAGTSAAIGYQGELDLPPVRYYYHGREPANVQADSPVHSLPLLPPPQPPPSLLRLPVCPRTAQPCLPAHHKVHPPALQARLADTACPLLPATLRQQAFRTVMVNRQRPHRALRLVRMGMDSSRPCRCKACSKGDISRGTRPDRRLRAFRLRVRRVCRWVMGDIRVSRPRHRLCVWALMGNRCVQYSWHAYDVHPANRLGGKLRSLSPARSRGRVLDLLTC
jgi:hypothetical protein